MLNRDFIMRNQITNLSSMPQQACLGQYAILQGQSIVLMIVENKNTRGVSDG